MRKSPCRVRSWTCIHVISINVLSPSMSFTNGKEQEGHRHDAEPCFTCIQCTWALHQPTHHVISPHPERRETRLPAAWNLPDASRESLLCRKAGG